MILRELEIKSKHIVSLVIEIDSDFLPLEVKSINDETYEFYINGIKKELNNEQVTEIIEYIQNNINQDELEYVVANEDYNKIFSKLDISDILKGWNYNIELINHIINDTMDVFVYYEEYEKCAVLRDIKNKLN